jgi:uncharacterized protein YdeI (YjbR/CyaY-like superfamily)
MATQDSRIDAYIAKSADFAKPILNHFRKLVHTACPEVEETIKWGMPFFQYKGMLCHMAAFKEHCAFGFWKGDLLFKQNKKIENKREEAMGHLGRVTSISDLPKEKALIALIKEAAKLNDAGIESPSKRKTAEKKELMIPDYFTSTLKKNRKAAATFEKFSYSHRKEYVNWVTEARTEETRKKRLHTAMEWLAEGKSRHWKYK